MAAVSVGYIPANCLVTGVNGTTITLSLSLLQAASGIAVAFSLAAPSWYSSGTWQANIGSLTPDLVPIQFGMNSNLAADDILAIDQFIAYLKALPKVPDIIIFTPFTPSVQAPGFNATQALSQQNQETRDAHALILVGKARRLGLPVIDINEWNSQIRFGHSVRGNPLVQPFWQKDQGLGGGMACYLPWQAPLWTYDWMCYLQITLAQINLMTTAVGYVFGIGSNLTNNLEIYRTAGGNFAVRIRLMDAAATSTTTSSLVSGAFTVVSGTGIAIGQKIVSTLFSAGTTVLSGSGTSWVASTNALSVGTDAAATFSIVPFDLYDTGVAVPTGASSYLRLTVRGTRVVLLTQTGSSAPATTIVDVDVERFGGLMSPRIALSNGTHVNLFLYAFAISDVQYCQPSITDYDLFGWDYSQSDGSVEPIGGNTVNHPSDVGWPALLAPLQAESFSAT